ncbi:M24 family metallopeptidase [Bacillus seohaeanensis]|jgi:Xaa-Pro dipeptidase|uniref:M24 family metallopeptidase n=1 Tax=Bacillus seohaeanensis TaxID=284580 RepID=A0ABW5RLA3_9BACI
MENRLSELKTYLKQNDWQGGVITSRNNIFYLSGFDYEPHERFVGIFIFPEKDPLFVLPNMEVSMLLENNWNAPYLGYEDSENIWEKLEGYLGEFGEIENFAVENSQITFSTIKKLQALLPNGEFQNIDEKLSKMRMVKSEKEIENLRVAAEFADFAIGVGINALKEGISELEVLGEIEYQLKKKGIREMSFSAMVLFGENASNPHGVTGENTLQKGDSVIFDLGVKYNGYSSDITRTVFFKETNEQMENIYNTVLQANLAAIEKCKVGNKIGEIDKVARKVISGEGYQKYFPHRIGHGLGIDVHEEPSLHANNHETLIKGMVLTVEPGIYISTLGGVRIEDDIVITENGVEILTKFSKELQIVKG